MTMNRTCVARRPQQLWRQIIPGSKKKRLFHQEQPLFLISHLLHPAVSADKCQDVLIDRVSLCCRHAMRETGIGDQFAILQQSR